MKNSVHEANEVIKKHYEKNKEELNRSIHFDKEAMDHWAWLGTLFSGIVALVVWSTIAVVKDSSVLLTVSGAYFIIAALIRVAYAFSGRKRPGQNWALSGATLFFIAGVLMMTNPLNNFLAIVAGATAISVDIFIGIYTVSKAQGFRAKTWLMVAGLAFILSMCLMAYEQILTDIMLLGFLLVNALVIHSIGAFSLFRRLEYTLKGEVIFKHDDTTTSDLSEKIYRKTHSKAS